MLILSRKNGESIIVGNEINITVLEARHNRVKLGVVAPSEVVVLREEVHLRKLQENENQTLKQTGVQGIEPIAANKIPA